MPESASVFQALEAALAEPTIVATPLVVVNEGELVVSEVVANASAIAANESAIAVNESAAEES